MFTISCEPRDANYREKLSSKSRVRSTPYKLQTPSASFKSPSASGPPATICLVILVASKSLPKSSSTSSSAVRLVAAEMMCSCVLVESGGVDAFPSIDLWRLINGRTAYGGRWEVTYQLILSIFFRFYLTFKTGGVEATKGEEKE